MAERRMVPCDHPYVVHKTEPVWETVLGRKKVTGQRLHFECGLCGEREEFERLSILTADEYNRKRGSVRMGHDT
jgi:hypothetical protein